MLNEYIIDYSHHRDDLYFQIETVKQFQNVEELQLYTDAGVHLFSGKATCGIIISDGQKDIEIKCRLPDVETKGATTAEGLSIAVGMKIIQKAGFNRVLSCYNDNEDVLRTINSEPSFKELVSNNRWSKFKIWEETKVLKSVTGI